MLADCLSEIQALKLRPGEILPRDLGAGTTVTCGIFPKCLGPLHQDLKAIAALRCGVKMRSRHCWGDSSGVNDCPLAAIHALCARSKAALNASLNSSAGPKPRRMLHIPFMLDALTSWASFQLMKSILRSQASQSTCQVTDPRHFTGQMWGLQFGLNHASWVDRHGPKQVRVSFGLGIIIWPNDESILDDGEVRGTEVIGPRHGGQSSL